MRGLLFDEESMKKISPVVEDILKDYKVHTMVGRERVHVIDRFPRNELYYP